MHKSFAYYKLLITGFVFILFDQIAKAFLSSRDFFIGPVRISEIKNYALPFGINVSGTASLLIVAAAIILLLIFSIRRWNKLSRTESFGLLLIFAGAVSNIIDRLRLSYVRDNFDFGLGVINVADAYIFLGIILLLAYGPKKTPADQS